MTYIVSFFWGNTMKRFMRVFGSAGVLVAAIATQSLAQTGTGRFNGGGVMHSLSQACINVGWPSDGMQVYARYHANGVGNTGDWESIVLSSPHWSIGAVLNGGSFSGAWQAVDHGGNFSRPWFTGQGETNHADVRILNQWPRDLTEATDRPVTIRGQIRHMGGTEWCRVDFDIIVTQEMR